jgi:hypothetical protein
MPGIEFRFVSHPVRSTTTVLTELSRLRIIHRGITYGDTLGLAETEVGMTTTTVCHLVDI